MRAAAPVAIVLCLGCSYDWDSFDPRLSLATGGAAGAGGALSGNGGAGGGGGCGAGAQLCDSVCVNVENDPLHCGDCATVCAADTVCIDSLCRPPPSCKALHQAHPRVGDGAQTLDPDGDGSITPFLAYCDMTTEGGGWTLVASVVDNSYFAGTTCGTACDVNPATAPCDETPFTSAAIVGEAATMLMTDHKSSAYSSVPFSEMLFMDSNAQYASYDVAGGSVLAWYPAGLESYVATGIEAHPTFSYAVKSSNVDPMLNVCGTLRVSFNVEDSDTPPGSGCHDSSRGPAWSATNNDGCFWDDGGVPWTGGAFFPGNTTSYRLWLVR